MSGSGSGSLSAFYVTGGTLAPDALSYVFRKADQELFEGLLSGEFCYVLTARQMGKSSLMVRAAARLRWTGVSVAVLDLTAIGQNVSVEQWYGGLLLQLGQQLQLEDELLDFWRTQPLIGPMQRWIRSVRSVVLPRHPGRLVIFVDEIDVVLSLPFSVDEFFAGIRECYNQRSQDPELVRLTFCLLGVAAPTDLVRETRNTPFNIGRRVELHDFTPEEAAPLARGLDAADKQGTALLKRTLYWTHGHPYLTQRLCQAALQRANGNPRGNIDHLCSEFFLAPRAHERDDNLLFVRERMLHSEVDLAALLDLYRQVWEKKKVRDDEVDPLITTLRLSGVARTESEVLQVRNRIYNRVFDKKWIEMMMPEAELRRQKAAYRRGIWRATLTSTLALLLVGALAFTVVKQQQSSEARATAQRVLYDRQLTQAKEQWDNADIGRVEELLQDAVPKPGQQDLRGFEWYMFWHLAHLEQLRVEEAYPVAAVAFTADGKRLAIGQATGNKDYLLKLYDVRTRTESKEFWRVRTSARYLYRSVAFSADGRTAVLGGPDTSATLVDVETGHQRVIATGHSDNFSCVALSADGSQLATADTRGVIKLWDAQTGQERATILGATSAAVSLAYSPDGQFLAAADQTQRIRLWRAHTGQELPPIISQEQSFTGVTFFPDGKRLLAAEQDGNLSIWNPRTRRRLAKWPGHSKLIASLAFSPDGKMLATGSYDHTVRLWSTPKAGDPTMRMLKEIRGHGSVVLSLSWSHDGKLLATGSQDNTVKIWDVHAKPEPTLSADHTINYLATAFSSADDLLAVGINQDHDVISWDLSNGKRVALLLGIHEHDVLCAAFSPDKQLIATGGNDEKHLVKLWDASTGNQVRYMPGHSSSVRTIAFSPDGSLLVSGDGDGPFRLWSVKDGKQVGELGSSMKNSWTAAFSPDGKYVATAARDGSVALWDVKTLRIVRTFAARAELVRAITFSPDGSSVVTGGDRTVRLWDVATGRPVAELGLAANVQRAVFSPDGRRLITGGQDGTIKIWDMISRQELMKLESHNDEVSSLTFSPDGSRLATSNQDGSVSLWIAAASHQVAGR